MIPSKVQVLTNVGLEHTRWLGPDDRRHRGREARHRAPGRRRSSSGPTCTRTRWRSPSACARSARATLVVAPAAQRARAARPGRRTSSATSPSRAPRPRPTTGRSTTPPCARRPRRRSCPAASRSSTRRPRRSSTARTTPAGMAALAALAAHVRRRPAARRVRVGARRQGRRGDAPRAPAAVRGGRLHAEREPAGAAGRDARVARPARSAGRPRGRSPSRAARCRRARGGGPDGVAVATGSIYLIADLLRPEGARGRSML